MKKLEDAPKELQDMFAELFKEHLSDREYPCAYKEAYAHFFLKGFDVAMATGGMKPKRTIAELITSPQGRILVKSNDGKLYTIDGFDRNGGPLWIPYPDLPQDER